MTDITDEIREKYLDRMVAKTELAKIDLEKNWKLQISSIAASLALLAGLGETLVGKFLGLPEHYRILYIALPLINTYLFLRFGGLASAYSRSRHSSKLIAESIPYFQALDQQFHARTIYETNSQFEYVHHEFRLGKFSFSLSIALVFALNHATTICMLIFYLGLGWSSVILLAIYVAVIVGCYLTYYFANRDNTEMTVGPHNAFLICVVGASALLTMALVTVLPELSAP